MTATGAAESLQRSVLRLSVASFDRLRGKSHPSGRGQERRRRSFVRFGSSSVLSAAALIGRRSLFA